MGEMADLVAGLFDDGPHWGNGYWNDGWGDEDDYIPRPYQYKQAEYKESLVPQRERDQKDPWWNTVDPSAVFTNLDNEPQPAQPDMKTTRETYIPHDRYFRTPVNKQPQEEIFFRDLDAGVKPKPPMKPKNEKDLGAEDLSFLD